VDAGTTRTIGKVVGGCGCFLLVPIAGWLAFVVYVGIQGKGNDEEASLIIGGVTCVLTIPVVLVTAAGWYFGLRQGDAGPPDAPEA